MNTSQRSAERESLILRAVWMLVFFFVWQLAELALLVVVATQLIMQAVNGKPNEALLGLGDSLSQYVAQIGRFGTFNTDRKPWPMSDWPKPRPADRETVAPVAPTPAEQEPQP
ncbi:DUF4389 domain-containing protein [Stutzerimonas zhaodongensis]|uniref:DUF4389 domain-containing protein n=1 Tax=Stutzerimonas zhaodongensis TaxID=1176257 RepID=A0A3M2HQU3_9GAMM|nr:DUF4389 domain-containing protein [Stutzerimonas zhaodongensis]MCQ4314577.1 DUF4389 domain-containing protein [Stutzerimonas zhaodongensis]RMH92091.1 DUF4389 domain-containing protein [Stutzerimonas zhaodongensis]